MEFTFGSNSFATGRHFTEQMAMDWQAFIDRMLSWRRVLRRPTEWVKLRQTPWIAPFILGDLGHRQRSNLVTMTDWIGFDLDKPGWTVEQLDSRLDGWRRLYYTTTNSRYAAQRWRIILWCDRYHTPDEHEAVWRLVNVLLDEEIDQRTKDATRLHYIPALWASGDNSWASYDGDQFPMDTAIEIAPPPEPIGPLDLRDGCLPLDTEKVRAALGGDPIITDAMVERARGKPVGGRLYSLMVGAAIRYRKNGWELSDIDLETAARNANQRISPGKRRPSLLHEARNAIAYAASFEPENALGRHLRKARHLLSHQRKDI